MAESQDDLARLRDLIAEDPQALAGIVGSGDLKAASAALARYAASRGLSLTPETLERAFQRRDTPSRPEPLDDEALNRVAGGGTLFCLLTISGDGGSAGSGGSGGLLGGSGGLGSSGGSGGNGGFLIGDGGSGGNAGGGGGGGGLLGGSGGYGGG